VTGDGDGLSIGGNHLIHRIDNLDIKIMLFNNRIYGLTKGQYSPTSELGKRPSPRRWARWITRSVRCHWRLVRSHICREQLTSTSHLGEVLPKLPKHHGTAFIEIYQNCNVFNTYLRVRQRSRSEG
jgi:2-oxoglutarate ferredoxin oxidoreductase subunit beta